MIATKTTSPFPLPLVSVIIPCRDEARHIEACLRSILASDYPADRMEVIVADGMSADGTRELVRGMEAKDGRLRLIDNPRLTTPAALNAAIAVSSGRIIIRMDAHASVASDYIGRCVDVLLASGADNVGGVMHTVAQGDHLWARAIAEVLGHPFGVGNSRFRVHAREMMEVDTVFGGCYRREVFDSIGLFNERLHRGQDMELNLRLRRAGGRILMEPSIQSWYHPKSSLAAFVVHNWTNGVWAVLPFRWSEGVPVAPRHLVPLAFVLGLAALGAASVVVSPARLLVAVAAGAYGLVALAVAAAVAVRRKDAALLLALPVAFAALHLPYGAGSIWGACRALLGGREERA